MGVATDSPHVTRRRRPAERGRFDDLRDGLRTAVRGPLPIYVAVHTLTMAVLIAIVFHHDKGLLDSLSAWDGGWYKRVADQGYEHKMTVDAQGQVQQMAIAFFPLYPVSMHFVGAFFGISSGAAGVLISSVAGPIAAVGIYAVTTRYAGHRTALIVVALWAGLPASFSESMVYTESLFTAVSVWSLYHLLRRQWLAAAFLCVLAGLCRSTAFSLIGVVCLSALIAGVRTRNWRALAAVLIAPMGLIGYMVFLWNRFGTPSAWTQTEKAPGWGNGWDWGAHSFEDFKHIVSYDWGDQGLVMSWTIAAFVMIFAAVCLVFVIADRRLPWELILWTAVSVLFTFTSGYWGGKARYVLPYFPLLIPLATTMSRSKTWSLVLVIGVLSAIGGWYGGMFVGIFGGPP